MLPGTGRERDRERDLTGDHGPMQRQHRAQLPAVNGLARIAGLELEGIPRIPTWFRVRPEEVDRELIPAEVR